MILEIGRDDEKEQPVYDLKEEIRYQMEDNRNFRKAMNAIQELINLHIYTKYELKEEIQDLKIEIYELKNPDVLRNEIIKLRDQIYVLKHPTTDTLIE